MQVSKLHAGLSAWIHRIHNQHPMAPEVSAALGQCQPLHAYLTRCLATTDPKFGMMHYVTLGHMTALIKAYPDARDAFSGCVPRVASLMAECTSMQHAASVKWSGMSAAQYSQGMWHAGASLLTQLVASSLDACAAATEAYPGLIGEACQEQTPLHMRIALLALSPP